MIDRIGDPQGVPSADGAAHATLTVGDLKGSPADEGEGDDEKGPLKWF